MIDIKALENQDVQEETGKTYAEDYRQDLINRGDDPEKVDRLLATNQKRKKLVTEFESLRASQKLVGQEIAQLKRKGEDASDLLEQMQIVSDQLKVMSSDLETTEQQLKTQLEELPNKFHSSVPVGLSEEHNVVVREVGEKPHFAFKVEDHLVLAEKLDIIDLERAAKVTGSRFAFMKKAGSQLERALIQYKMDLHTREHGYEEMIPPFMVNTQSMFGTGQFPKFKEDVFHISDTDYYLIPTAETSVTNYYAGEMLQESQLPQSFCAYSPCFRSEAGSHGKDTRGIFRVHQFNKVELLHFAHPEDSYQCHERLVGHAERVLKDLELHYRVVNKCTSDMTFSSAKCYDIEVWLPGQEQFREISSCSNFEDFQARRADIRFRPTGGGKPRFVHTLNGSGLAVGRTVIAILENYQREDGSVEVPEVLRSYMGGLDRIERPQ
jgi:seryl-tRNA synthetase